MDLNYGVLTFIFILRKNDLEIKPLGGLCLDFVQDFFHSFKGGLHGKSFIGNIQYFGAEIFSVVWPQ